ncbi:MAG: TonB-dependent receptor, partial [Gammaproteobacteria bacterium]
MEEIFVTGSRIARSDLTANSPISIISSESLRVTNTVNVEEYLRKMPQFAQAIGRNSNNGNPGVSTLDLRNLGEERTLVLMDGRRLIPYDADGVVDVSMVPAALIERVEVITGGASSVYGADAVAGVVNFIMKKDFEGIEFNGSAGITEEGDGNVYDFAVTFGGNFADGRGNLVFSAGFTKQDGVTQGEREFGVEALDDLLNPVGSFTTPQGTAFDSSFPGDTEGGLTQFDPNGNTVPFSQTFNFNPFNLYQTPVRRWTLTSIGHYDVTDDIELFARASFSNSRVDTIIAPSGTFFESFSLSYLTNPFLGPGAVARFTQVDNAETDPSTAGDGIVDILLGRRLVEVGTRNSNYENTAYQIVSGLKGEFADSHKWEIFGQWGRTSRTQNFDNDTTISKVQQSIDAILDPTTNQPVCVDPSGNCVPANLFGGTMSPEAADFLRTSLVETNTTSQMVFGGSVTGDLPL